MFVDRARIQVKGGDGGNGCISFRREKFVPFGGPAGGDGGEGGDVVLVATTGEQSLVSLVYQHHYQGANGGHGSGRDKYGRCGKTTELRVPIGTLVKDMDDDLALLCDLDEEGARFVVKGGRGGRGNIHFATSTNRAPRISEPGGPGEIRHLELELKTIADIGLVGYPNAGKSTLLGAVSNAHPKTAAYPFTTLHPVVGIIDFPDFTRMSIADIPGLIEGASDNVGLGHDFLRHIERTRVLVYVLDMAAVDGREPLDDLASLKNELELYQEGLSKRTSVIAANKLDLPEAKERLEELRKAVDIPIFPISASEGENLDVLIAALKEMAQRPSVEPSLDLEPSDD